jgi:hypothetical protein
MTFTTRTVTATYKRADNVSPASGWFTFTPNTTLQAALQSAMYPAAPVRAVLDATGSLSVTLVCTDSTDVSPSGWAYVVTEQIAGAYRTYSVLVPSGAGAVDLSSLAPLGTPPALVQYLLASSVGQVGGPAGPLDSGGKIPSAQVPTIEYGATDHGLAAWTFPWSSCNNGGSSTWSAGVLYLCQIKVTKAATISKATFYVIAAGGTLTNCFVGLYDSTGTLRASTVDQGTAWQTTGLKQPSFQAGYAAPVGMYWLAFLVGSGTMPAMVRAASSGLTGVANLGLSAGVGNLRYGTSGASQTALPGSFVPTAMGSLSPEIAVWAAAG